MQLWTAIVFLIACTGSGLFFVSKYRKSKKVHFLALTVTVSLLALLLLAYSILTLIMLVGMRATL